MRQATLFQEEVAGRPPLHELQRRARQAIGSLIRQNVVLCLAYSGGKDSGVVCDLTLSTAAEMAAQGYEPLVLVTTSDTGIENPEVHEHYLTELRRMEAYAKAQGFRLIASVVTPNLLSTWQMKVLSGRGLPSFAGQNTDCATDWKVGPQARFRERMLRELADEGLGEPVTLLGTRFSESQRRAVSMRERGERDDLPVRNSDGVLVLSPIAHWTTEDVWEHLGEVSSGLRQSYTDFRETLRIYAHSEGTNCSIVADAILDGLKKRRKGGCGARHGCFLCLQAEDKSLENMLQFDERYAYMRGLNKLNKFLRATRWDWRRRNWIGRTIRGGYIQIQPDTYHPSMIREIFRYMLQLDFDERQRAARVGEAPKFSLMPLTYLVALDALWSLNGLAAPFAAWADYRDVYQRGIRYDVPQLDPVPEMDMPEPRYLHVGDEWDDSAGLHDWSGLRDPFWETMTEGAGCWPALRTISGGRVVWDVPTEGSFEVDAESAYMLHEFELDRMLEIYDADILPPGGVTYGYKYYLSFGALSLSAGQVSKHDEILRRTAFKDRLGLTREYDIDALLARAVRLVDLPEQALEAWKHKATSSLMQYELEEA